MMPQSASHIILATVARSVSGVHDCTSADINSFTFMRYLLGSWPSSFDLRRARRRLERIDHDLGRVVGRWFRVPSAGPDGVELVLQLLLVFEAPDDLDALADETLELLLLASRQPGDDGCCAVR